jgi:hypothetical protein
MEAPFGVWKTQTVIAGMSHDNLIAPWIITGAMDGNALNASVTNGSALELQPGIVVICDKLAGDYARAAASALRDVGCWLFFLPPCARALNPAEMACPNPKARLRRIEQRPIDQVIDAFTKICNHFSPDDCWNVFCEAGCGSNEKRGALAFGKHRETYKEPLNQCHFGRGASSCS